MEALEKFIEKRMQQSEFSAMMIPRYLEKPNAFLGSKNFTLEQGKEFEADAKKCKAVLNFLKQYNNNAKGILTLNLKLDFIFNHKTQNELAIEIGITQWELLQKIKDYSFDKKQLSKISKIYRELYLKDKRSNVL